MSSRSIAEQPSPRWSGSFTYAVLVGLPALLVVVVLRLGERLPLASGVTAARPGPPGTSAFDLGLLILQVVVVVGVSRIVGAAASRIGQPRVVGEMAAGLLLGPSVFGRLSPSASAALFPPQTLGFLNALAQVGLLLFMFLVGLELEREHLRERRRAAVLTSHASIVAPFLLGTTLALFLYRSMAPAGVEFTPFALFMGAAMSVTAFPVLARILADRKLTSTPLGALAITCAAVDDITAWCILAAVAVIARAGDALALATTLAGTAGYLVVMLTLGRRALAALTRRAARGGAGADSFLAGVMLFTLGSAWVTERLGIHALFGAFLVGALLPRDPVLQQQLQSRLRDLLSVLLLPLFFAFTGLRATIGLIADPGLWGVCALILVVAVAGKLGGSALAARSAGMPWRDALSLGCLLNTRGLMELVILNVGLDLGVLTPTLFAMMVIMALVTTALTTPLLDLVRRGEPAALQGVSA